MAINTTNNQTNSLFKKSSKGEILLVGSGKYFRSQKAKYSSFAEPCKKLYEDQVRETCKNLSPEKAMLFSF